MALACVQAANEKDQGFNGGLSLETWSGTHLLPATSLFPEEFASELAGWSEGLQEVNQMGEGFHPRF